MKYMHNIDMDGNELQNVRLHPLEELPEKGKISQICYDTKRKVPCHFNGEEWVPMDQSGVSYGFYSLEVDADGNLWAVYPDGDTAPPFEFDAETGDLYFEV